MLHRRYAGFVGEAKGVSNVIPFAPRQDIEEQRAQALLARAGDLYQKRLRARERLPGLLAALAKAGMTDLVLRAVRAWGEGELDPAEVLEMVEVEAAVAGVRDVF